MSEWLKEHSGGRYRPTSRRTESPPPNRFAFSDVLRCASFNPSVSSTDRASSDTVLTHCHVAPRCCRLIKDAGTTWTAVDESPVRGLLLCRRIFGDEVLIGASTDHFAARGAVYPPPIREQRPFVPVGGSVRSVRLCDAFAGYEERQQGIDVLERPAGRPLEICRCQHGAGGRAGRERSNVNGADSSKKHCHKLAHTERRTSLALNGSRGHATVRFHSDERD